MAGVLYVFGFIVAATLGCTAGSVDLTDGMFRHLVVTGRSRLALYLARIPAGLAIIVPLVAIGFTIVCGVCVFAAPTTLNYQGVNVPAGLSRTGLETLGRRPRRPGRLRLPLRRTDPRERALRQRPGSGPIVEAPTVDHQRRSRLQPAPAPLTAAQTQGRRPCRSPNQDYADYSQVLPRLRRTRS